MCVYPSAHTERVWIFLRLLITTSFSTRQIGEMRTLHALRHTTDDAAVTYASTSKHGDFEYIYGVVDCETTKDSSSGVLWLCGGVWRLQGGRL